MDFNPGDKVSFLNEPLYGLFNYWINDTHVIVEEGENEEPVFCPMCGADAIVTELLN